MAGAQERPEIKKGSEKTSITPEIELVLKQTLDLVHNVGEKIEPVDEFGIVPLEHTAQPLFIVVDKQLFGDGCVTIQPESTPDWVIFYVGNNPNSVAIMSTGDFVSVGGIERSNLYQVRIKSEDGKPPVYGNAIVTKDGKIDSSVHRADDSKNDTVKACVLFVGCYALNQNRLDTNKYHGFVIVK
jgi:hypothetical protein